MRLFKPTSRHNKALLIDYFDFIWITISPFLALALRGREFILPNNSYFGIPETYYFSIILIFCSIPVFISFRVSESLHHLFSVKDVISIFLATILSILIGTYVAFFFNRMGSIPRSIPLIYGALLIVGLTFYRVVIRLIESQREGKFKSHSDFYEVKNFRRIIIIGLDHFSINTIRLTEAQHPRVIQVIAAFSSTNKYVGRSMGGVAVLGDLSSISNIISEYQIHGIKIDELWLSDNTDKISNYDLNCVARAAESYGIPFKRISEALNLAPDNDLQLTEQKKSYKKVIIDNKYFNIKRLIDLFGSLMISVLLIPIIGLASSAVIFDIGSPIFFWQERQGRYGSKLFIYKIRTLSAPLIYQDGSIIIPGQISRIGRFLRSSRIDELPQILNVIVGDMSLIGPRPLLTADQPADPSIRHLIRPGLTGWAQVNGGDYLSVEDKNILDCYYVFNASFLLDIKIFLRTIHLLIFGIRVSQEAIEEAKIWCQNNHELISKYSYKEEPIFKSDHGVL
jgi:lipopolysaccharide/colanic/teichoic acid biosynthesis glycosyltransferase